MGVSVLQTHLDASPVFGHNTHTHTHTHTHHTWNCEGSENNFLEYMRDLTDNTILLIRL